MVAGTTTTALSPPRIDFATPLVFDLVSTHVPTGPLGPLRVALADDTDDGISAMRGSPTTLPLQPQKVRGSGDSAMNRVRRVVAPSPGNTTGTVGSGMPQSFPRITSRVPADFHGAVEVFVQSPNPVDCRLLRRTPTA